MDEIFEEHLTLENWQDLQGGKKSYGAMRLDAEEILDNPKSRRYKQTVHEATGNEGATLERQYQQAVIVLRPRDRYFRILAAEGSQTAVPALAEMLSCAAPPLEDCRRFAAEVMQHWKVPRGSFRAQPSQSGLMLELLKRIGAAELSRQFVEHVLPTDFLGGEGPALCQLCQQVGWKEMALPLQSFVSAAEAGYHGATAKRLVPVFEALCCGQPAMTAQRRGVCVDLAERVVQSLEQWDKESQRGYGGKLADQRVGLPEAMIRALSAIGDAARLDRFIAHMLANPKCYSLRHVLAPAVKAIHSWIQPDSPGIAASQRMREHVLAELRQATAAPIEPPVDWRREAELKCTCADCRELVEFLRSPVEQVHRFAVRQERRQHLHQQIDAHGFDLTHETLRRGSPQTLVCTKTRASYERRAKQFVDDCALLEELNSIVVGQTVAKRKPAARKTRKPSSP